MIHLRIVSHDEKFAQLTRPPIIVNHLDVETSEGRELLQSLLYTRYEGDSLNVLPTCDCGEFKGNYLKGVYHKACNSVVQSVTERALESTLWIECPKGVTALINPAVWTILSNSFTTSGCNILEWLCNPQYQPPGNVPEILSRVEALELPRGYNAFHDHFDEIMEVLFRNKIPKGVIRQQEDLWLFIQQNRDKIFSKYLPIPSKIGFILESNSVISYADLTMTLAIDALKTIASIENSVKPLTQRGRESRTLKAITQLSKYYVEFAGSTLSGKPGIFRKHVFGGRPHWTGRAVITSISEPHDYEELHLPWSLAVQLFKVHLSNKLLKRGYTPLEIQRLYAQYTNAYHPVLDELFKELIKEAPNGLGIPCIFQRNPSLARASAQRFYIRKVKTDPEINSVSLSVLVLSGPN